MDDMNTFEPSKTFARRHTNLFLLMLFTLLAAGAVVGALLILNGHPLLGGLITVASSVAVIFAMIRADRPR
jgi:heme A synthase